MDKRYFSNKIVKWYGQHKRDLPWRHTKDPYKIWLSEIILQQTRVIQGLPYYLRFVERFPKVQDLASASEQEVLRLWQGLGYYTRARNLHKCAKVVVAEYGGEFPDTYEALKKLPGIGDYTAAAIASFAFGEKVAVVDGNVFRVLARIYGIDKPINTQEGRAAFSDLANTLIPEERPDTFNQAVMEFGALFCTPKNPLCSSCDFQNTCFASQQNLQENLPVKIKLKSVKKRFFYYLVFKKGESLLMKKRMQKDIWHGLYDFMLIEKNKAVQLDKLLEEIKQLNIDIPSSQKIEASVSYKHVLTHQVIEARFIVIPDHKKNFKLEEPDTKYYSTKEIMDLPKPILINKFLSDHQFL
jgi:A/G-specific adenine glycosylase